ncbi:carboxypeptidase M32 [Caviibacter abscessus]|uniref:carboxypeptidase M32 n=1 Tax=Caviibacter abscessus TaxID=1766719 RepID=UPI00082D5FC5|nr:carboxypeptidase M32 [Caviibacter abscessus]
MIIVDRIYEYIKKDSALNHAMNLLSFDLETQAPKQAIEGISNTMGVLSQLSYLNFVNPEFKELLYSIDTQKLSDIDKKVVEKLKKNVFEKMSKIPIDEYSKYTALVSKSSYNWEKSKNENDYNIFKPYLKQIIDTNKKFITYRGYKDHPYNVLLDDFETGLTVDIADKFFNLLKEELSPFIIKVLKHKDSKIEEWKEKLNSKTYDIETQKKLCKELAQILGFDFTKGVMSESEHPFTVNMNNKDVRITSHYYEHDILSGIYSVVHETGHAIYEQQIADEYDKTRILAGGSTMGIHEAQSRFYENVIGKQEEFSYLVYELIDKYFGIEITKEQLHLVINSVSASFIRTDADELTYPIHVLIRYEIEREMLSSEIDVDKLPTIWNDMYEKYLGIRPDSDTIGILQDSHWSGGLLGYFPSYAIGSAYASQMYNAMLKKVKVSEAIKQRDFSKINEFLRETIHQYGSAKTPAELIFNCSKEEFNPHYYVDYLKDKFSKLYNIEGE